MERELAIRTALGASRVRLIRQLLTESVLLSMAGGALGLALAPSTLALLVKFAERFTTRANEIKIDAPVLIFTILISAATGILFGLAPAFTSGQNAGEALKQGSGRSTAGRGRRRLRAALVIAQVAVSFMLLIGAGLMIRSFVKLQDVNPGFNPDRLLTMRISPNFTRYTTEQQGTTVSDSILRQLQAVRGVQSVAMASNFPFNPSGIQNGPGSVGFEIEGRPLSQGALEPLVDTTVVSSDYFQTIRQPLAAGQFFTDHDDAKALQVAMINQTMARHRWPSENPVGKRISFDQGKTWTQIVGVVGDTKEYGLERAIQDETYFPVRQQGFVSFLILRTQADAMTISPLVRAALHDVDAQLAIDNVETVDQLQHELLASPRVTTLLLGIFAALALIISAFGIAAVMALSVSQRTQELGIRMALGASPDSVVGLVVRQGLMLAIGGTIVGICGALVLTRMLTSLLYNTSPTDAITFASVSAVFLITAALACFIPARQATRIDPLIALRQE